MKALEYWGRVVIKLAIDGGLRQASRLAAIVFTCLVALASVAKADYGEAMSALRGTNGQPADFRRAERLLRACAWQDDDILCQIALGDLYEHGMFPSRSQTFNRPVTDNSEALVWYFIALVNLELHDATLRKGQHYEVFKKRIEKGCDTAYGTARARGSLPGVQDRIAYIYRSRGASGWNQMGEVFTDALFNSRKRKDIEGFKRSKRIPPWYKFEEPPSYARQRAADFIDEQKDSCVHLFEADHAEARLHFLEAAQNGHPFAEDAILVSEKKILENGSIGDRLESQFGRFLIYPPFKLTAQNTGMPAGKVPPQYLTDESDTQLEREPVLNNLAVKKPHEKSYLTRTALEELFPKLKSSDRIKRFRQQLNFKSKTTSLTPWEIVLALKLAVNSEGTRSANLLGEMYFNGIGVPVEMDYARHAFEIAAFKGNAKFGPRPHAPGALDQVIDALKKKPQSVRKDIDKNAVKNLCLILADDTRFPNHRTLAESYLKILTRLKELAGSKTDAAEKDCKKKLGLEG